MIRFKNTNPDDKTPTAKAPKVAVAPPVDEAPGDVDASTNKGRTSAKAKKGGMQRKKPMGR